MTLEREVSLIVPPLAVSVAQKTIAPFAVIDTQQATVHIRGPTTSSLPQYIVTCIFHNASASELTSFCEQFATLFPTTIAPAINQTVGTFLNQPVFASITSYPLVSRV